MKGWYYIKKKHMKEGKVNETMRHHPNGNFAPYDE